jgi:uncharacterized protein
MTRRHLALIAFATLLAAPPVLAGYVEPKFPAPSYQTPHKVVYHFNSNDAKLLFNLLGNIQHHSKAVGGDSDIRLVIHNDGVWTLQNPSAEIQKRLDDLRSRKIVISICNTSLKGRDIDWHSLYGVAENDIVQSGVAELADLQMRGFAYIKP